MAALHVDGWSPDWTQLLAPRTPTHVDLPTYPFQRERYWLEGGVASAGVTGLGLEAADHPLLGAQTILADSGGVVLTGRLSLRTQPWLADHVIGGEVILPGTAFLELAVCAGDQVGCGLIGELVVQASLRLPAESTVRIQVLVGPPDDEGARSVSIYSQEHTGDVEWTPHATGVLLPASAQTEAVSDKGPWPPRDAQPVSLAQLPAQQAAGGLEYGTAFQGLAAVWRLGEDVLAEVRLPEKVAADAHRYGLHPAALDAAIQALPLAVDGADGGDPTAPVTLPFLWSGVSLFATGAATLRVRFSPDGADGYSALIAAVDGEPVASLERMVFRPVAELSAPAGPDLPLYRMDWTPMVSGAEPHVPVGEASVVDVGGLVGVLEG
ncbi:polyketide synthase dehydratase domain-containing protein, partial [Streptomyces spiramenti]